MAGKPIVISIVGDNRDLKRTLGDSESRLGKFGRAAGKGIAIGAVAAGAALAAFGVKAVSAASDAQQSIGATETIFGRFANTVVASSNKAATQFGLSANEYRENANLIGALFKNQGVSLDKLAGKTQDMIGTASDLAATFGGTTSDAVAALSSAFKGEFDPLERYGISLKQSTINAELAAKGQDKLTGAAKKQAEQQALTALITKQAGDSLGAFGRETDTLAHQQQVLGAQWDNLTAKAGTVLLPMLTSIAKYANETIIPAIGRLASTFGQRLAPVVDLVRAAVAKIKPLFEAYVTTVQTKMVPALQNAINKFRDARPAIDTVFNAIGKLAGFIVGKVLPAVVRLAGGIVSRMIPALASAVVNVFKVVAKVIEFGTALVNAGKKTVEFARTVIGKINGIPGAIRGAATKLYSIGSDLISGLLAGIRNKASDIASTIQSYVIDKIPGPVRKALGINSPSKVFKAIGHNIVDGLTQGIRDQAPAITRTMNALARDLATFDASPTVTPSLSYTRPAITRARAGGAALQLTITADQLHQLERGRAIDADLKAYRAAGGH